MADASFVQTSFAGGEWSHFIQGRFDRPDYRTALNVCFNSLPTDTGAWVRRPGTQFAQTTRNGLTGRLIKFDFQQNAPYNMEFTDGYLRMFTGPALVSTNDNQTVSAISAANPAVIQTATAHGWSTGNQVMFPTLSGAALLQNRQFLITVVDTTHFSLQDAITLATIDGSTLSALVSGTVARVLEIATPYTLGSWASVRSVQAEQQAVLLQSATKPQVLTAVPPAGGNFATFRLAPSDFKDGPYLDPIPTSIVTPSAQTGVISLTFSFVAYDATVAYSIGDFVTSGGVGYKSLTTANLNNTPASSPTNWQVVQGGAAVGPNGFVASDVGRLVRLFSEPSLWLSGSTYSLNQVVSYNGGYWVATGAIAAGIIPGTSTLWAIAANAAQWTWGQILSVSATGLINPALAGSANIGSFASNQNAAFDTIISKTMASSLTSAIVAPNTGLTFSRYGGKDYSLASAQVIQSATVTAPSDLGITYATQADDNGHLIYLPPNSLVLYLHGSATPPSTGQEGTILGSFAIPGVPEPSASYVIQSSDQVTAWAYSWVRIAVVYIGGTSHPVNINVGFAQVQLYTPNVANGSVVSFQIRGPALLYSNAIRTWRLGVYSNTTGWPACGTYHEGRLWLSGAVDNRIDSSKSNDLFNFAPTNSDGSVSANNAISYTFDAPDTNPIYWMEPDLQGIVCGTQAGEWLLRPPTAGALSPTNIAAQRVTKIGCANIEPRRTDHTIVLVQKFARRIMEYFADVFSGKFSAPDLAATAKHLTAGYIDEIAYQQELSPIVWSRVAGALRGCSYSRDSLMSSQGPKMAGWHRHALGSGRTVESIVVGPSTDGNLDALAMVTTDPATSIRHVEIMTNLYEEGDALGSAWYLDDAVTPTSTSAASILVSNPIVPATDRPYGGLIINGLWHLNGKTVQVFAAGLDCGQRSPGASTYTDFVVSNGSITIPYGDGISAGPGVGLFTADFAATALAAGQIVVGFTYTSDGQIVRPNSPAESGARNGPAFGKKRRSQKFAILVDNTAGLSIGTTFDKLDPVLFKDDVGNSLAPGQAYSGIYKTTLTDNYSYDSMLCWRVTRPFPANVMAIGPNLHTQDE